jgi:hypothetical protein
MSRIQTHDRTHLFLLDIEQRRPLAGFSNEIERWDDLTHTHHHQQRHVAVLLFSPRDCSMPVRVSVVLFMTIAALTTIDDEGGKNSFSLDSRQLTRGNMNRRELKI